MSVAADRLPLLLAFNPSNQLAVRVDGSRVTAPFAGAEAAAALDRAFPEHTPAAEFYRVGVAGAEWAVAFVQVPDHAPEAGLTFRSLDALAAAPDRLDPVLAAALAAIEPHLIAIPYLHLGENDYIYKFRIERERNRSIYAQDDAARALYQSKLCEAIKALARTNERSASAPSVLDFGAVRYVIPSHFGFCLGVKYAIERAY